MGDKPEFTEEEKRTGAKLKKICESKRHKSWETRKDCYILKKEEIAEYDRMQSELRSIAAQNLNTQKLAAFGYVTAKMFSILVEGQLLSNALQKASGEYDQILQARASLPILQEIATTLILTILPELKIVGRTAGLYINSDYNKSRSFFKVLNESLRKDGWKNFGDELLKKAHAPDSVTKGIQTFANYLDNQSKDIIEAVKNPLSGSANYDAETQTRLAGFSARNQILTDIIKSIETRLVRASKIQYSLYMFIVWYQGQDVLSFIKTLMKEINYDTDITYSGKEYDLFADLILYDMLKAYAHQYCAFELEKGTEMDIWEEIKGLDQAQRGMIYKKFGIANWKKSILGYPSVNNSVEIWAYWDVKINHYTVTKETGRKV